MLRERDAFVLLIGAVRGQHRNPNHAMRSHVLRLQRLVRLRLDGPGGCCPAAQARVCVHISHIHSTYTVACARRTILCLILCARAYAHPRSQPPRLTRTCLAAPTQNRQRASARRRDPEVRARLSHSFARGGGSPGPPPVRVSRSALSAVVGASAASASDSPSSAHSRLHSSGVMATRRRCARKPASPAQGTQPASTMALGSSRSGGVSGVGAPRAAAMARCSGMGTSS